MAVCAQGSCHREGTSGQDPAEHPPGKQEPLWPPTELPGHGGTSPPTPPTGQSAQAGTSAEVCVKAAAASKLIGKRLKVFGDRMTEAHRSFL